MVDLREIDLVNNKVTFEDFSMVTYNEFYDVFVKYWDKRIAGETLSPFDMERFMKRSSSKNLKQLIDGKKSEGFEEATIGKKLEPGLMRIIVIGVIVGAITLIALVILKQMGVF